MAIFTSIVDQHSQEVNTAGLVSLTKVTINVRYMAICKKFWNRVANSGPRNMKIS
jgi:hypothetical protein